MSMQSEVDAKNRETSKREVADFIANPPAKYFAYVDEKKRIITTWTGDKLGSCQLGRPYRSNMGDTRQAIWVQGINGRNYQGTYFTSAGDYCRIKLVK